MSKRFITKPCTGNLLEELLNDMDAKGYDPIVGGIIQGAMMEQENRLAPGHKTLMPLFTVVFERRGPKLADA